MIKNKTFKKLEKNLTETKKADRKKIVFNIIDKWFLEVNENRQKFRSAFLSNEMDKQFQKIKDRIGEFKDISKMSVLDFLAKIIIGYGDKFFMELYEEFLRKKEKFYDNYKSKN